MSKCMTSYAQGTEEQETKIACLQNLLDQLWNTFALLKSGYQKEKKTKIGVADNNLFLI